MLDYTFCAIIIALFIVLLAFLSKSSCSQDGGTEDFDTYYNHDMGIHSVYQKDDPDVTVDESSLQAKYNWAGQDRKGYNVVDKYYEEETLEKNSAYDPLYMHYNEGNDYDTKFLNLPAGGFDMSMAQGSTLVKSVNVYSDEEKYKMELAQKLG